LRNCEPWNKHLREEAYFEINKALKQNNYQNARMAIDMHLTETADRSCITILKMSVVEVCTTCITLLKEALPNQIIFTKS
jgi:hypothetical protein